MPSPQLERLNQAVRHPRFFENRTQWADALVSGATGFCNRAALFEIAAGRLQLLATKGLTAPIETVPLASAPAFAAAAESRDTVVALRTAGELSAPIAAALGDDPTQRFTLFPLVTRTRVVAILYADGVAEPAALELLAAFGSAVLMALPPPSDLLSGGIASA